MIGGRKVIAVCIARIQDEATNGYITALHKALPPEKYTVFVYNTCAAISMEHYFEEPEAAVYELIDYEITDAVIIFEEVIRNQILSNDLICCAKNHGVPAIVIGEPQADCINIRFDHENAIASTVRHLIDVHHLTKLHFMAGIKDNPFSEYRLEAFKRVLEEKQMPFADSMVSYGDFWSDPAERETEKLIASGNIPQAIICANDKMAIAVCGTLRKHGIRVPEDVAVTGFDGIKEIAFSSPRITSSVCDLGDLAMKTAKMLEQLEKGELTEKTHLVEARLCLAESCGCHGERTESASEYLNIIDDRFYRYQEEALILSQLTARIQQCENIDQVEKELKKETILYDLCCVLETDTMNEMLNPTQKPIGHRDMDRDVLLVYDSYTGEEFKPYTFPVKRKVPYVEYLQENGRMLIFTALHYMNICIGYVCFFYSTLEFGNYVKIPQTVNALNNAIGGYRNLQHERYLMKRLDTMYKRDALTGLYNRRGFELAYERLLAKEEANHNMTIILADLDRLKYINDTFGHKEGDFAIRAVAQALVHCCPKESLFTRFGGDEMLAVCYGEHSPQQIKENLKNYFTEFNEASGKPYPVEASVGIYETKEDDDRYRQKYYQR